MPPLMFVSGGLHSEGVFSTFSTRGSSLILVGLTLSVVMGGQISSCVVGGPG